MIRLLNLGPAKHEKVAIYVVNQRFSNVCRIAELLRSGAIQVSVGPKYLFALNNIIIIIIDKKPDIVKQIREF